MKPLSRSADQRVLEALFLEPETVFSLTDLAKKAKVAKPHIGPILKTLEKEELIAIERLSTVWRITARREERFFHLKLVYNLHALFESDILDTLNKDHPKSIILFGSYRYGEDTATSDIDIAIEEDKKTEYRTEEFRLTMKHSLKRVQLHYFHPATTDKNVLANIANGIVLVGTNTWTTPSSTRSSR